jgi:hypothetical protein
MIQILPPRERLTSDGAKRRSVRVFHWRLIHSCKLLISCRRWRCNQTPDIVNCCWLAPVVFPSLVEGVFHVKSRVCCGLIPFTCRHLFAIVYNRPIARFTTGAQGGASGDARTHRQGPGGGVLRWCKWPPRLCPGQVALEASWLLHLADIDASEGTIFISRELMDLTRSWI